MNVEQKNQIDKYTVRGFMEYTEKGKILPNKPRLFIQKEAKEKLKEIPLNLPNRGSSQRTNHFLFSFINCCELFGFVFYLELLF